MKIPEYHRSVSRDFDWGQSIFSGTILELGKITFLAHSGG